MKGLSVWAGPGVALLPPTAEVGLTSCQIPRDPVGKRDGGAEPRSSRPSSADAENRECL